LILMDMKMPIIDGYTAAGIIRGLKKDTALPVIAMTAHTGPEEIKKCLEAGCTDYIDKPINRARLIGIVKKYLGSDKYSRAEHASMSGSLYAARD